MAMVLSVPRTDTASGSIPEDPLRWLPAPDEGRALRKGRLLPLRSGERGPGSRRQAGPVRARSHRHRGRSGPRRTVRPGDPGDLRGRAQGLQIPHRRGRARQEAPANGARMSSVFEPRKIAAYSIVAILVGILAVQYVRALGPATREDRTSPCRA